jgi:hypothetical protein
VVRFLRFTSVGSGLGGDMVSREVIENGDNGDEIERGSVVGLWRRF